MPPRLGTDGEGTPAWEISRAAITLALGWSVPSDGWCGKAVFFLAMVLRLLYPRKSAALDLRQSSGPTFFCMRPEAIQGISGPFRKEFAAPGQTPIISITISEVTLGPT